MKISVITVCLNSRDYIEVARLQSVIRQNTDNYEHIIIDGVSNDGTLDIIENTSPRQIVISEPDKGIYYAMNKGVDAATGDVIGFLNADDVLASPSILADITTFINNEEVDIVYGNIEYRERNQCLRLPEYGIRALLAKKIESRLVSTSSHILLH